MFKALRVDGPKLLLWHFASVVCSSRFAFSYLKDYRTGVNRARFGCNLDGRNFIVGFDLKIKFLNFIACHHIWNRVVME
jgi:hypothetical protein